jgi:hypothetical protein
MMFDLDRYWWEAFEWACAYTGMQEWEMIDLCGAMAEEWGIAPEAYLLREVLRVRGW